MAGMSHILCSDCWPVYARFERAPFRLDARPVRCCFCGALTADIPIREDPASARLVCGVSCAA